jgi:predicted phage terminase large subunit-like protein
VKLTMAEFMSVLRRDFPSFIERAFYEVNPQKAFLSGPHIELIAARLEDCRRGKTKRLIINLPPRNLKSHCASIAFPAWLLGHNPAAEIICVSYGQDLSDKLARDFRSVMQSDWYQRLFATRSNRPVTQDFETTEGGVRMATSIGGVLTGRGGDFIIIDDPLKPEEALSEPRRKSVNEWYSNTLLSRLNDKRNGCIIIIMQRLHQDDLVGHVLEQGEWEVLSLPAIAMNVETHTFECVFGKRRFDRHEGEALHPEREPLDALRRIRQTIGEYNFLSQYQQDPAPLGGMLVKSDWLRYYEPGEQPRNFVQIVQSWDTANKATELSDFSVCTTWGVTYKQYYLLDVFRRRLNFPDLKRAAKGLYEKYRPNTVLIEDKASGTQLIQELKAEGMYGVSAYDPPAGSDKIMRLHAQTAAIENGIILLPKTAPWLADYVHELTSFPASKHSDQVDSTTQALDYLRSGGSLEVWARLGQQADELPR